ncbi:hypothetical protein B0T17DRAFT_405951 [Bombardia bombarda]|uniref:CBM-cenC domain-containing protein n=1 Tax=Bombardia bombarda TaxID=252184 RepID=A0AA39TPH5_9PEZI|nr:hypothetical protein B0T17DRAFT_405951 [Bombardia bombarda]
MRSSWTTLCVGAGILAGVANAGPCSPCGSTKCFGAVNADLAVGESFCSSWLSLAPVTTTVTEVETATATLVSLETVLTTITATTATVTQTGSDVSTIYLKKRVTSLSTADPEPTSPADPTAAIISQCSSNDARISSACRCVLASATASTVTAASTAVSTAVVEATSTVLSTATANVVATVSVDAPAVTIAANPVINGNLESYVTTGNILPWADTASTTGGRLEVINGVNPCTSTGYCAGGRVVVRVYPPTTSSGYTAMRQTFDARPSTVYNVSFLYRCLNYDANSRIEVWYAGVKVGTANSCGPGSAFVRASGIQFTTSATGRDELQVRYVSSGATPYLYYYADDFQATHA